MPQLAFFVAGISELVGGAGLLLAWDRFDRGPSAADDIDINGCQLYALVNPILGPALPFKMITKGPIAIPEENCPTYLDGFPDQDLVTRFEIKPGGTTSSHIQDFTLELFNGSTRIYGVAPEGQTLKIESANWSLLPSTVSFQDKLEIQPWEDPLEGWAQLINSKTPSKEIWRSLMTPNDDLTWLEI